MSTGTRQLSTGEACVLQSVAKPMRYARYASHAEPNGDTGIDNRADSTKLLRPQFLATA